MMILQEHLEMGFLGHPPVILTASFMHGLIPKNIFEKIKFNEADNEVACLTQAERHYFIYCMFNAIRVDADGLFNIFVAIENLSIVQIRDLHNLFFNKESILKDALLKSFRLSISDASSLFQMEFEEMQRMKEARAALVHLLKVEYGLVGFTQADRSFVKRANQPIQIPDCVLNREFKEIDFRMPKILEESLFKKGINKEDKRLLWRLVLNEFSMDREGKIEFILSLSSMTRKQLNQWIKEFLWSEKNLERSLFNLLLENSELSTALTKFEEFYRRSKIVEQHIVNIPAILESRLKLNKELQNE